MPNFVAKAGIKLRLELCNLGNFEVVAFNANWAMGTIPSASCLLAIGRNAASGLEARVHSQGGKLTQMHRAKVYLTMDGAYDRKSDWPKAETMVFDGYLTGVGHRKVMGQSSFLAHLVHWAADLDFSSSLSEQSHAANPSDYTFRATFKSKQAGVVRPQGIGLLTTANLITADTIGSDLWGDALKPFFCSLSQEDRIKANADAQGIGVAGRKNDLALAALRRFEGGVGVCGRAPSQYYAKLAVDINTSTVRLAAARAISDAINRDSIEAYAHTTLWGMLVGQLGPRFLFATLPLVDTAIVAPHIHGLRDTYARGILAEAYEFLDLTGYVPRPIKGVGILGSKEMAAGTRDPNGRPNVASSLGIGGYYAPDPDGRGQVVYRMAPAWLTNIACSVASPSRTTGLKGKLAVSSATTPRSEKEEKLIGDNEGKTQGQRASESSKLYNAYAQAVYANEALRGRQGMLSGKLRFDIAPGSNIRVQGGSDRFLNANDALGQNLVATVLRVSVGISAEMGRAGTGFQLGSIRTEAENERDATSVEQHPLYTTKFLGAPLVPAYVI